MEPKTELPSYKCAVCKSILVLYENHLILKCHFCELPFATIVYCEKGHFVCPICDKIHAAPPEDDKKEDYEKEREEARELYDDRADIFGTVEILIKSSVSPDREVELGEFYDPEHDFDEEIL